MPSVPVQSGQDWASVNVGRATLGGNSSTGVRSATGAVEKRYGAGGNSQSAVNARKLEESEELKHQKVDKSLSKAIMQARTAKKMTQKDLATKINEKPQVIGEYENGKAIPNGQIIVKIERALGCKLPRPNKKPSGSSAGAAGAKKTVGVPAGASKKGVHAGLVRGGPPKRR